MDTIDSSSPSRFKKSILKRAFVTAILALPLSGFAQELIYQEGFNTDGSKATPARYTVVGGDVWELSRIFGDQPLASASGQRGPIYFGHNFDVSFVGIPNIPARRMMFCWRSNSDIATVNEDLLKLWDSSVAWLLNNKPKATVMVSNNEAAIGGLADRLRSNGYTVIDDDPSKTDTQIEGDADLFIHAGGDGSRYALIKKPVIAMNASADYDDLIVGSIGSDATFTPGQVNIGAPGHPAAGGKTGSFTGFTGSHNFAVAGRFIPEGSTLLATVNRTVPPTVVRLSDVDDMIAGTKAHSMTTELLTSLDIQDVSVGNWEENHPVPGGYTGNWGLRIEGKLSVSKPGTYRFALGSDDGARFQIDSDKNGFTFADTVIDDPGAHGHTIVYANMIFATAGTYNFEVRSYNSGGSGDFELSVGIPPAAEIPDDALDSGYWELLGAAGGSSAVQLNGQAKATGYIATGADTETKEPLIVLLNGPTDNPPGAFYGGGALIGFEGTGFFGGAGMNKFPYDNGAPPRSVILRPINVAGKKDVRLTIALAGAQIDFENDDNDFLNITVRPNGAASAPVTLASFHGVENGRQPWLADRMDGSQRRLTKNFSDFIYNIPTNATEIVIKIDAGSSWWNELLGFDNIRITSGLVSPIAFTAPSLIADDLVLNWSGGTAPFIIQGKSSLTDAWIDLKTTAERSAKIPLAEFNRFFRVKSE